MAYIGFVAARTQNVGRKYLKVLEGLSIKGVCGPPRGLRSCRPNPIGAPEAIESSRFSEIGTIKSLK